MILLNIIWKKKKINAISITYALLAKTRDA